MVEHVTLLLVVGIAVTGIVSSFASRLGVAAPLLLVVVGTGLSTLPWTPHVELDPHIILGAVLPPLLYAAALHVPYVDFRRNLKVIGSLAVVLVLFSAGAAALTVTWLLPGVSFALALALGAVVAPPDAVAALSLGRRLGLPPRVVSILEGEGLVNDATALVLLSTAVSIATAGLGTTTVWGTAASFAWAVAGAIILGLVAGKVACKVRTHTDDDVLDIATSMITPFTAFLLAEAVHASGVVAVVVAGIVVGNLGPGRIAASSRRTEGAMWEAFIAVVENGVFLLMGYLLPPLVVAAHRDGTLLLALGVGGVVTVVLILVRFAYLPFVILSMRDSARRQARRYHAARRRLDDGSANGGTALPRPLARYVASGEQRLEKARFDITAERDQRLGWRDYIVISLAGMRGVVTIAGSQTLPPTHPQYQVLVLIAFIVALATLLPQGFLLAPVVKALHLRADSVASERRELSELSKRLVDRAEEALDAAIEREPVDPRIEEAFRDQIAERRLRAEKLIKPREDLTAQFRRLRTAELRAERAVLTEEKRRGEFSSQTIERAERLVDDNELRLAQLSPGHH